jgi:hypothetical protein
VNVIGIDPGNGTSGVVRLDGDRVVYSIPAATVEDIVGLLDQCEGVDLVAVERVRSYSQSGNSLLETAEVVGRLQQAAIDRGLPVVLLPRLDVVRRLGLLGLKGNKDSHVRARLIDILGAPGKKSEPGPTYGVTSHAWQALAVAYVASR